LEQVFRGAQKIGLVFQIFRIKPGIDRVGRRLRLLDPEKRFHRQVIVGQLVPAVVERPAADLSPLDSLLHTAFGYQPTRYGWGLGGVLTCGVTGMGAGLSHSPVSPEGRERYVFFAFPHCAVDESGNQLSVFGRLGARPFSLEEMRRMYLRDGKPWTVKDGKPSEPSRFAALAPVARDSRSRPPAGQGRPRVSRVLIFAFASASPVPGIAQ
jgi:hypothetical protein